MAPSAALQIAVKCALLSAIGHTLCEQRNDFLVMNDMNNTIEWLDFCMEMGRLDGENILGEGINVGTCM